MSARSSRGGTRWPADGEERPVAQPDQRRREASIIISRTMSAVAVIFRAGTDAARDLPHRLVGDRRLVAWLGGDGGRRRGG